MHSTNPALHPAASGLLAEMTYKAWARPQSLLLTLGEPDFDTPEEIVEAACSALRQGDCHYPPFEGKNQLRQALADYEKNTHKLSYEAEEILITAGATGGIYASLQALIKAGDEVIIPLPAWNLYENIVRLCGGKPVFLQTRETDFQIRKEELRKCISQNTQALVLCNPGNPTGLLLDEISLTCIKELVLEADLYLICDEVYRNLVYEGPAKYLSNDLELKNRLLVIQSFSKPWAMTGWRLGYVLGPRTLLNKVAQVHQWMVTSVNSFAQAGALQALQTSVEEMKVSYKKRRDLLVPKLEQLGFRLQRPQGAFYVFPALPSNWQASSVDFAYQLLEEEGVAVVPGEAFGVAGHLRISYCCSEESLEEAIRRMRRFLEKRGLLGSSCQ